MLQKKTDLFGKVPADYKSILKAKNSGIKLRGLKDHKFDAITLGKKIRDKSLADAPAQGISFLTNNLQAVQARILEIFYTTFRLDDYFPIKSDIPEGATTYAYRVVDKFGTAGFIENFGTNASTSGTSVKIVPYNIRLAGIDAQWSIADVRSAQFAGVPLETESLDAGTQSCMQHTERVGLGTSGDGFFEGMLNASTIPVAVAPATWPSLSTDALVSAIKQPLETIIKSTNEIFGRNIKSKLAIYLSIERANLLTQPRATFSDKSVWDLVRMDNIWTQYTGIPLEMRIVEELTTAGGGSTQRALYGYPDNEEVWEMAMPIRPRVINIFAFPRYFVAPIEYSLSGLNIKRPGGLLYLDEI